MPDDKPSGSAGKGKYPPTIVYYNDKEKELKELKEKVEDKLGMAGKEVAYYHAGYKDKEASAPTPPPVPEGYAIKKLAHPHTYVLYV